MNFTWFASAYDTDDVPYRLLTLVQMAGVLVLAAGVPAAFGRRRLPAVTLGYLIMRVGLVAQWLRAGGRAPGSAARRRCRYAVGITVVQVGWLIAAGCCRTSCHGRPSSCLARRSSWPCRWWAERTRDDRLAPAPHRRAVRPVHHHPARRERARRDQRGAGRPRREVERRAWWSSASPASCCCSRSGGSTSSSPPATAWSAHRDRSFLWGYGHYGLFAALAALGAGLEVAVEQTSHHLPLSPTSAGYAVAVPAGLFVALLWGVTRTILARPTLRLSTSVVGVVLIGLAPLLAPYAGVPLVVVLVAAVCVLVVAVTQVQEAASSPGTTRPHS